MEIEFKMITLRKGSGSRSIYSPSGSAVRLLQTLLMLDSKDGLFGTGTENAVIAFQKRNGLSYDGIVGPSTWSKLLANRTSDATQAAVMAVTPNKKFDRERFEFDKAELLLALWGFDSRKKVRNTFEKALNFMKPYLEEMHLDKPEYWIAFAAQIREETGHSFNLVENLNYRCSALPKLFKNYRVRYSDLVNKHGRCGGHSADQVAIANHAYAFRMGNGSPETGDGWRTRGGGAKQVTGFDNHYAFDKWFLEKFPDLYNQVGGHRIKSLGADALKESPLCIISAVWFWMENDLYKGVDLFGLTRQGSRYITRKVNPHTSSYSKRYAHMVKAKKLTGVT